MLVGRQAVAHGVGGGLGAVGAAGFGENVADVRCYGVEADRQHGGDVGVAAADRDEAQYLGFAGSQVVGGAGSDNSSRRSATRFSSARMPISRALSRLAFSRSMVRSRSPGSPRASSIAA